MTDKLDVEAHSGPCDKFGICELCTLRVELRAKDEAIAREHDLYLTAHRDNMKAATMLMEMKSRAAALEKENADLRLKLKAWTGALDVKRMEELLNAEKERDELRAALSGRTVSCSNCNALQAQLAQAKAEALSRAAEMATCDLCDCKSIIEKEIAAIRQSVPASHDRCLNCLGKLSERDSGFGRKFHATCPQTINAELEKARAFAIIGHAKNFAGYTCAECQAFWYPTGYGKPWHEPGCSKSKPAASHEAGESVPDEKRTFGILARLFCQEVLRHPRHTDHACRKCPGATMIQEGFICAFHEAEAEVGTQLPPTASSGEAGEAING